MTRSTGTCKQSSFRHLIRNNEQEEFRQKIAKGSDSFPKEDIGSEIY
jgi:hypothetical protein